MAFMVRTCQHHGSFDLLRRNRPKPLQQKNFLTLTYQPVTVFLVKPDCPCRICPGTDQDGLAGDRLQMLQQLAAQRPCSGRMSEHKRDGSMSPYLFPGCPSPPPILPILRSPGTAAPSLKMPRIWSKSAGEQVRIINKSKDNIQKSKRWVG